MSTLSYHARKTRTLSLFSVLFLGTILGSCSKELSQEPPVSPLNQLFGEWKLVGLSQDNMSDALFYDGSSILRTVNEFKAVGSEFTGTYTIKRDSIIANNVRYLLTGEVKAYIYDTPTSVPDSIISPVSTLIPVNNNRSGARAVSNDSIRITSIFGGFNLGGNQPSNPLIPPVNPQIAETGLKFRLEGRRLFLTESFDGTLRETRLGIRIESRTKGAAVAILERI